VGVLVVTAAPPARSAPTNDQLLGHNPCAALMLDKWRRTRFAGQRPRTETVLVDPNEIGHDAVVFLTAEARFRNMRLRFEAAGEPLPERGDRVRVSRCLLLNRINNINRLLCCAHPWRKERAEVRYGSKWIAGQEVAKGAILPRSNGTGAVGAG
jgi:hypothetical protein